MFTCLEMYGCLNAFIFNHHYSKCVCITTMRCGARNRTRYTLLHLTWWKESPDKKGAGDAGPPTGTIDPIFKNIRQLLSRRCIAWTHTTRIAQLGLRLSNEEFTWREKDVENCSHDVHTIKHWSAGTKNLTQPVVRHNTGRIEPHYICGTENK